MNRVKVTGMVISAAPIGEYDKRVVILTKEKGKIAAFARGARKPGSALMGAVAPFSFGEFDLYEGRTSYTLTSASIRNYFEKLREDIEGACYGFYFMEIADYYAREGNDETELLKLLYQTFRALLNPRILNRLIRCVYEIKAVSIGGEAPQVFQCLVCGEKEGLTLFSAARGGLLCGRCGGGAPRGIKLDTSAVHALQYIVGTPVERLYTFAVSKEVLKELEEAAGRYIETYVDQKFKSLEILEQMISPA